MVRTAESLPLNNNGTDVSKCCAGLERLQHSQSVDNSLILRQPESRPSERCLERPAMCRHFPEGSSPYRPKFQPVSSAFKIASNGNLRGRAEGRWRQVHELAGRRCPPKSALWASSSARTLRCHGNALSSAGTSSLTGRIQIYRCHAASVTRPPVPLHAPSVYPLIRLRYSAL